MSSFADPFEAQSQWRRGVRTRAGELLRFLEAHELADDATRGALLTLAERLASDRLVLAFVAEFSRGKSELINAIFFADAGRRVLPATPGRTTMCPVELAWNEAEPPALWLLPIDTRLDGLSLAELRAQPARWTRLPIDLALPDDLPDALAEVTRTVAVSVLEAGRLGFWNDEQPADNPPLDDCGRVLVPAWRHARIDFPHPLLRQGLVVIDTPGLNAIGAEPELTLGLLPSAHATVFLLGADTGVTKSDMAIWRDHLGAAGAAGTSRFVVLNKIDTLADPLLEAAEVARQIARQAGQAATALGVPPAQVFALSARQALAARLSGDDAGVAASGIVALEQALAGELLPQRRLLLQRQLAATVAQLQADVARRLADERRQGVEQVLELRGLRGKSGAKLKLMLGRIEVDAAEFERCTSQLQALRAVHTKMLKELLHPLSNDRLRDELLRMQADIDASLLNLGARKAFAALCARLRTLVELARQGDAALRSLLEAQFTRLNADFGFALAVPAAADLAHFAAELELIEQSYTRYLGLSHALRLTQPKFREQFRRMLVSKLRVVFESASADVEQWHKTVSAQIDAQLRDRRRGFRKRRDSLTRVQGAAGELAQRISDLELQDRRLIEIGERAAALAAAVVGVDAAPAGEPVPPGGFRL